MNEDNYKETFDSWNKLADLYQQKFMQINIYNKSYDVFLDLLKYDNSSLLELGCGPGNITQYLLRKKPQLQILGTDISANMIELAKKNNPEAEFEVIDCRAIGALKKKFDGIVIGFCLPYLNLSDADKLIEDCANILNSNGALYISYVADSPTKSGFKTNTFGDRVYFNYYEKETLQDLLTTHGFEKANDLEVPYHNDEVHTIFITTKKN